MKWQDYLDTARSILAATKAEYPGGEGVMAGGGGGSSGAFNRSGYGIHERYHGLPNDINSLVTSNAASATVNPVLAGQQSALFSELMTATPQEQPGFAKLSELSGKDPQDYTGRSSLQRVASIDPYSGDYEAGTLGAYRQRAGDAMAMVETGPNAVRGGSARSGIMQGVLADRLAQGRGQEIRQARQQDVGNVLSSLAGMASIEGQKENSILSAVQGVLGITDSVSNRALGAAKQVDFSKLNNLQLLQLAAGLQGTVFDKQTDNFTGQGDQSGWQSGVSCCFIFLQGLNGMLPWYINLARRDYYTPTRRRGYKWMASWLVPAMKKSRTVQWLVNSIVIKPFLRYGAYIYGDKNSQQSSALLAPYCKAWLAVWGGLGKIVNYVSRTS